MPLLRHEVGAINERVRGVRRQRDRRAIVLDQLRRRERLVDAARHANRGPFDHGRLEGVFEFLRFKAGVTGVFQFEIGSDERGQVVNGQLVFARLLPVEVDQVGQVVLHQGQSPAKDRVVETLGERQALLGGSGVGRKGLRGRK